MTTSLSILGAYGKYAFPAAVALNMFSMTVLMIVFGFLGSSDLAADVGIVQGATMAVFMAFSANARSLILGGESEVALSEHFYFRAVLLLPLSFIAYLMSIELVEVSGLSVFALVLRRCAEWISELHITEREKVNDRVFAYRYIFLQLISFSGLILTVNFNLKDPNIFVIWVWSISPVILSYSFVKRICTKQFRPRMWRISFWPHLGSSWIISISTYVFRVLIVLLAGKSVGGMLFSAYAVGGMVNSIYVYALGPSLAKYQSGDSSRQDFNELRLSLVFITLGVIVIAIYWQVGHFLEGQNLFWNTIGFSLIGGGIMLLAQKERIRILQIRRNSVFVPDMLANILIISTVPFAYYLFGIESLSLLFLWSAFLNYVFYLLACKEGKSEKGVKVRITGDALTLAKHPIIQAIVLFCLFLPVFFQLSGNIFDEKDIVFNAQRDLLQIPLPIAVFFCFFGIALLLRYREVTLTTSIIFTFFMAMLLSSLMASNGMNSHFLGKLILLVQIILPCFALILGQSYVQPKQTALRFEAVCLYMLILIVPGEVLATFFQNMTILSPYLYAFSLYQHLYYLPVIFVGLYFLVTFSLYEYRLMRLLILLLAPFIGIYTALSQSVMTILIVFFGSIAIVWSLRSSKIRYFSLLVASLCCCLFIFVLVLNHGKYSTQILVWTDTGRGTTLEQTQPVTMPSLDLKEYWTLHWDDIIENPSSFFWGREQLMDRRLAPSAYNYYLDLLYNFGVFSLLPLLYLLFKSLLIFFRRLKTGRISPDLLALGALVFFFLLVDNSLKVGLRQPYPGMITFFLWGVLLNRIGDSAKTREQ